MHKVRVQVVESAGKLLGKVADLSTPVRFVMQHGDNPRGLYAVFNELVQGAFHGCFQHFVSLKPIIVPVIHSTYKDKQKSNFKFNSY